MSHFININKEDWALPSQGGLSRIASVMPALSTSMQDCFAHLATGNLLLSIMQDFEEKASTILQQPMSTFQWYLPSITVLCCPLRAPWVMDRTNPQLHNQRLPIRPCKCLCTTYYEMMSLLCMWMTRFADPSSAFYLMLAISNIHWM